MVSQARARRISDRVREELAVLLQREISDPRLEMVTVTAVDVDRELAFATIYITAIGDDDDRRDDVLQALEGASGFIRKQLSARIRLRHFPKLRFRWDASQSRGARIDELLDMLKHEKGDDGDMREV
jgi:ribosome-binding factor A